MNTKNIFRILLVAVTLFLGTNNVKADFYYENAAGSNSNAQSYTEINVPFGAFDDCRGAVLKITYDLIPLSWSPNYQIEIGKYVINVTEGGVYEQLLDDSFFKNIGLNTTDSNNRATYIAPRWVNIYKIEIVPVDGGSNDNNGEDEGNNGGDDTGNSGEGAYVPATISSSTGYATFCSDQPLDFSGITTVTAYYAAAVSDTKVTFKQIRGTVAAGTGLLLKGETSQIPVAETGTPASYPGNLLVGVTTGSDRVSGANLYVLVERNGEPVFAETAATPATVPAGKAYLSVQSSSNSRILTFSFAGESTSINAVETTLTGNEVIYNLRGQRVTTPTKGLYIVNGKKVLIK